MNVTDPRLVAVYYWKTTASGLTLTLSLLLVSCSSSTPARIMPPQIDAVAAGKAAIAQYDTNKNGLIEGSELDSVVSIKSRIDQIDTNGDKHISAEEITSRIYTWREGGLGIIGDSVRVMLDGEPLKGAIVKFLPEKFLSTEIKPAQGTTDEKGIAMMTIDDPDLKARRIGGVQCGFYRVEISKDVVPPIPSRYNTNSILGEEVAPSAQRTRGIVTYKLETEARNKENISK